MAEKQQIVEYDWQGEVFQIKAAAEFHEKLLKDTDFANDYFEKLEASYHINNQTDLGDEDPLLDDLGNEMDIDDNGQDDGSQNSLIVDEVSTWTTAATKILLDEYTTRLKRFQNPNEKKRTLWREIKEILKNHNFHFDMATIQGKFRNMKHTYGKVKRNKSKRKTGAGRKVWPWIKEMDEIFHNEQSIHFSSTEMISSVVDKDGSRMNLFCSGDSSTIGCDKNTDGHSQDTSVITHDTSDVLVLNSSSSSKLDKSQQNKKQYNQRQKKYNLNTRKRDILKLDEEIEPDQEVHEDNSHLNAEKTSAITNAIDTRSSGLKDFSDTAVNTWTVAATKLLLDEYKTRVKYFRSPIEKKITLWKEIKEVLGNHGFDFDVATVQGKFRNMKHTYRKVKKNNSKRKTGVGRRSWPWVKEMDEIFHDDESILFSSTEVISSIDDKDSLPMNLSCSGDSHIGCDEDINEMSQDNSMSILDASDAHSVNSSPSSKPDKSQQYKKLYYHRRKQCFSDSGKLCITNKLGEEIDLDVKVREDNDAQLEAQQTSQLTNAINAPTEVVNHLSDTIVKTWTFPATQLLIDEYKRRVKRFRSPKEKKITLWKEIEEVMQNQKFNFDMVTIHGKFRNMKHTYRKIKKNNSRRSTGVGRHSWPWLKEMDEIFQNDKSMKFSSLEVLSDVVDEDSSPMNVSCSDNSTIDYDEIVDGISQDTCVSTHDASDDHAINSSSFSKPNKHKRNKKLNYQTQKQYSLHSEELNILKNLGEKIDLARQVRESNTHLQAQKTTELINAINARTGVLRDIANHMKMLLDVAARSDKS